MGQDIGYLWNYHWVGSGAFAELLLDLFMQSTSYITSFVSVGTWASLVSHDQNWVDIRHIWMVYKNARLTLYQLKM